MKLSSNLNKAYTEEHLSAHEAQLRAEFIAWGPVIFQATRIMLKHGILDLLRNNEQGLTLEEIVQNADLSEYAVKCLMEASLCIGTVLINTETGRYRLSKTGWVLLVDPATRADIDFNHDVNYEGWFRLEESFINGKPEGLRHFGDWPTIYEGLSSLPEQVQKSWFAFDHFYSDNSFEDALKIVFSSENKVKNLFDVGGNTGRWALRCVAYDQNVNVTILDLPQQLDMMKEQIKGKSGAERIHGYGINFLDPEQKFPKEIPDVIWMSQFLDCFGMDEITSILKRAREAMNHDTRLYIMETLWDRQKYEQAALALTMTSLYFSAMANGNSKMYNTEDLHHCIKSAGLEIEKICDGLGHGHSILICRIAK